MRFIEIYCSHGPVGRFFVKSRAIRVDRPQAGGYRKAHAALIRQVGQQTAAPALNTA
jgi:hypothetical protein